MLEECHDYEYIRWMLALNAHQHELFYNPYPLFPYVSPFYPHNPAGYSNTLFKHPDPAPELEAGKDLVDWSVEVVNKCFKLADTLVAQVYHHVERLLCAILACCLRVLKLAAPAAPAAIEMTECAHLTPAIK